MSQPGDGGRLALDPRLDHLLADTVTTFHERGLVITTSTSLTEYPPTGWQFQST
jgi:hypothetical protein